MGEALAVETAADIQQNLEAKAKRIKKAQRGKTANKTFRASTQNEP